MKNEEQKEEEKNETIDEIEMHIACFRDVDRSIL